ncbi:MAG: hypothetical protein M9921_11785 [Fimbriimonadaceae bacterium]|nr:hypothetical protein [Chthonomonadaceae bacterium]MCO5297527.1 hypothetical protein [Fimbriimonadaceae bacterium]
MDIWRLCLLGEFRLYLPDGNVAPLTMRKAQGLIAILASSPNHTLDRVTLQEALWPDSTPALQQASLRQALAHIRKHLTCEFVVSTRSVCRIGAQVHLSCDAFEADDGGEGKTFLPEFPEPWFERERRRRKIAREGPTAGSPEGGPTLIEGFLALLRWYSSHDPIKSLALMRDHVEVVDGIPPRQLYPLLESSLAATKRTHPLYGWGLLWKGICLSVTRNVVDGEPYLQRAIQLGIEHRDSELLVRASCFLASNYAMTGKFGVASRTLQRVEPLVGTRSTMHALYTSSCGAVLHHAGRATEGLRFVRLAAESSAPSVAERNRLQALLGVFLSTNAGSEHAMDLLAEPEAFGEETGNTLILLLVQLGKGQVLLNENCPGAAARLLGDLARQAARFRSNHLELYARESWALASLRMGDTDTARREIRAARRLRTALGFGFTPWDVGRLGELSRGKDRHCPT